MAWDLGLSGTWQSAEPGGGGPPGVGSALSPPCPPHPCGCRGYLLSPSVTSSEMPPGSGLFWSSHHTAQFDCLLLFLALGCQQVMSLRILVEWGTRSGTGLPTRTNSLTIGKEPRPSPCLQKLWGCWQPTKSIKFQHPSQCYSWLLPDVRAEGPTRESRQPVPFFCSGRARFVYFSCEGPRGAAAGRRGCDNGRRLRGPPASRSSRFPPRPQGQKTIHTRQKPDCAAELEKLVLGRKGWGRGPSEAPGPLASQKVPSLGDASCQGHLSNDQRPTQGRWCCWEPLGRDRSCRRTGRGGAEGPQGRQG